MSDPIQPFTLAVPEAELAFLTSGSISPAGPSPRRSTTGPRAPRWRALQELVSYWRDGYDWRGARRG